MTPQFKKAKEDLLYASYAFNRVNRPDITPEKWALVYDNAAELEERYQAEKAKEAVTIQNQ